VLESLFYTKHHTAFYDFVKQRDHFEEAGFHLASPYRYAKDEKGREGPDSCRLEQSRQLRHSTYKSQATA
jgi:hypothetical protein